MHALPEFLKQNKTRRYILKNHVHSETKLPWLYLQSFLKSGRRAIAEQFVIYIFSWLKYITIPLLLLALIN